MSLRNLAWRLCTGSVLIALVLWTLCRAPLWVFSLVVIGFAALALFEFFTMVRHRGILVHRGLGVALGVVFMSLVAWRSFGERAQMPLFLFGPNASLVNWTWDIFWPATIVIIFLRQFTRQNTFEALNGLATTLFGLAYIAGLFSYVFYIRAFAPEQGAWLVLFLVLVTKMSDVGAFAVGNLCGRHALVTRISPRKTVEGFVGGVALSGATAWAAAGMVPRLDGSPALAVALGMFLGVCGQLGDLAESLIKRDCQIKDAGQMLPGLGGVLDVLDSLLFTAPIFYGFLIYG